jgi:hypothetical protein
MILGPEPAPDDELDEDTVDDETVDVDGDEETGSG